MTEPSGHASWQLWEPPLTLLEIGGVLLLGAVLGLVPLVRSTWQNIGSIR